MALATWLCGEHHGAETTWKNVASLEDAENSDLAFAETHIPEHCNAAILLTKTAVPNQCCIVVDDPKLAFIRVLESMFSTEQHVGIHPKAEIEPSAFVHATATIHAGVVVMDNCSIGADTVVYPNVVLYPRTEIGDRVKIHAGSVIGSDGFGYHPTQTGPVKIPHIGRVVIENDVEVGANATIDRAFLGETRIGSGSKIDNLVHIGHNGTVGQHVIIAAQTGLSGSVTIGSRSLVGGQVGVVEHTTVGEDVQIGAQSGVVRDIPDKGSALGTPAETSMRMKRIYAALRQLADN